MAHREMNMVFFGTSEFGAIVLEKLVQADLSPVLVVTAPDKPAGRKQLLTPPPVKSCILKHETWNLKLLQPEKLDSRFTLHVSSFKPDLIVLAAYGKIIPKEILEIPKYGALNVHPSLLPKYRGPSPIQTTILQGDEETGVSIIRMDEGIDHGPVVANVKCQMSNVKFTYPELHDELAELGGDLLTKTIPDWVAGKIKPVPQDHSKATLTKMFKKEDGRIDWNKDAEYIERQVRAFYPWPGTYTKFEIRNSKFETNPKFKTLKILKARVLVQTKPGLVKPGLVFLTQDKKLAIQTKENALIIEELQLEGGKPMSSKEFLLGHKHVELL